MVAAESGFPSMEPLSLNADAGAAADAPTVANASGVRAVAWVEGGRALARFAVASPTIPDPPFGPPVDLGTDPSRVARWPRAAVTSVGGVALAVAVAFVEAGPAGDEIWVRRLEMGTWSLLPGPVNAGAVGPITGLAVGPGPAIAWADREGNVRIRVLNR